MWDVLVWVFIILALLLLLFVVPEVMVDAFSAFLEFILDIDDWD